MNQRMALALVLGSMAALPSCGGGSGGGSSSAGSAGSMDTVQISHGFGILVPHQTFRADSQGNPTPEVIAITKTNDLAENVSSLNPIFNPTSLPATAVLPDGSPGNHFLFAEFTQDLDVDSVLTSSPTGQSNAGLVGSIVVLAFDPGTGTSIPIQGRAFIGGRTYAGTPSGSPAALPFQQWVTTDSSGNVVAADVDGAFPGVGFPGTQSTTSFPGADKLVQDNVFVFIADDDGDLSQHDTFPSNRQITIRITQAVTDTKGTALARQALGSTTVGPDNLLPELASTPPPNSQVQIVPGAGQTGVDPTTPIRLTFTEPIQPHTLGQVANGSIPTTSSYVSVTFGPTQQATDVPFTVLPVSALDLSLWEITPGFAFPGQGPANLPCNTFNEVRIATSPNQLADLSGNSNQLIGTTSFFTGEGPGIVNAPVAPDVIYASRLGALPAVSVIDLNGFGQSTGNPTFDFVNGTLPAGNSNFPNNPNVFLQGSFLRPILQPGTCTVDGGSEGVFTLTKDSNLDDRVLRPPVVTQVGEIMTGWSLDVAFNNGQEATGCQAGGGNLCAISGNKLIQVSQNSINSLAPTLFANPNNLVVAQLPGGPNPISFAPHPNPPALTFPPLCQTPFVGGQEPTSIDHLLPSNGVMFAQNLLVPGDPFGDPNNGIPPSGLLTSLQNSFFQGPSVPGVPLSNCQQYQYRQQVGHFLYVADRARREIVVLNSNRFTVIDRIQVSDPTDMAMGPNLDFLAVSNQASDTVTFININPGTSTFHQVVKSTQVGRSPRGIAWDPANEDVLVCNEGDSTMSILSAFDFEVRKTVSNSLNQPFDVAITQRQLNHGWFRNVYFAWILNRNGSLSIFESGPDGVNGWGFDNVVGTVPFTFANPRKVTPNTLELFGGVWVAHGNPLDSNGVPDRRQRRRDHALLHRERQRRHPALEPADLQPGARPARPGLRRAQLDRHPVDRRALRRRVREHAEPGQHGERGHGRSRPASRCR